MQEGPEETVVNCPETIRRLDDYFDGCLSPAERAELEGHARACGRCADAVARERALRERLRRLPAPAPDLGRFEQAMAAAAEAEHLQRRKRWMTAGGAMAAAMVLMIGFGLEPPLEDPAPGAIPPLAEVTTPAAAPPSTAVEAPRLTMALNEEREIRLALESKHVLEDATFTILLPEGIEIRGFPGLREVSWVDRLEPGTNLLVLPLTARAGDGGEVTAHVTHVERRKSVTVLMNVAPPEEPPVLPGVDDSLTLL